MIVIQTITPTTVIRATVPVTHRTQRPALTTHPTRPQLQITHRIPAPLPATRRNHRTEGNPVTPLIPVTSSQATSLIPRIRAIHNIQGIQITRPQDKIRTQTRADGMRMQAVNVVLSDYFSFYWSNNYLYISCMNWIRIAIRILRTTIKCKFLLCILYTCN